VDDIRGRSDREIDWLKSDAELPAERGFIDVVCNGFDIRRRYDPTEGRRERARTEATRD
jgi:hypothetical protein